MVDGRRHGITDQLFLRRQFNSLTHTLRVNPHRPQQITDSYFVAMYPVP
jgi:hypothetical protein